MCPLKIFEMKALLDLDFLHEFQIPFFFVKTVLNPHLTLHQQCHRNHQQGRLKERLVSTYQPHIILWTRPVYTQSPTMRHRGTVHTVILAPLHAYIVLIKIYFHSQINAFSFLHPHILIFIYIFTHTFIHFALTHMRPVYTFSILDNICFEENVCMS